MKRNAWLFLAAVLAFLLSVYGRSSAAMITGQLVDEDGDPLSGVSIKVYATKGITPQPPDYETPQPDITATTGADGGFSMEVPKIFPVFDLEICVDKTYYQRVRYFRISNTPGKICLGEPLVILYHRGGTFWVSHESNSNIPNSQATFSAGWEETKDRGKIISPLFLPATRILPVQVSEQKGSVPTLQGLPKRKIDLRKR